MTITFSWWAVPMAVIIIGFITGAILESKDDWGAAFAYLGSIIAAVSLTIGHYI